MLRLFGETVPTLTVGDLLLLIFGVVILVVILMAIGYVIGRPSKVAVTGYNNAEGPILGIPAMRKKVPYADTEADLFTQAAMGVESPGARIPTVEGK